MMNGSDNAILILLICTLLSLLVFLITIIILKNILKDELMVQNRIKKIFNKRKINILKEIKPRKKKGSISDKIKISSKLESELQTAGILMRVEEFAIIWIVLSFVPSGITAILSGNMMSSLTIAALGIIAPPLYVNSQKKKRVNAFENQLGDALVVMSNCLHSGLTLNQAMDNISKEMSEPISKEFFRVSNEIKYGSSPEKALNSLSERINSSDLNLFVSAVNIQRQIGGNLSQILENISHTIKERIKLKSEIKVLTATGRTSGMVIGFMPIAIGLILMVINTEYMMSFFKTSSGRIMLVIGAVMELIGFIFIKKIVTIKY